MNNKKLIVRLIIASLIIVVQLTMTCANPGITINVNPVIPEVVAPATASYSVTVVSSSNKIENVNLSITAPKVGWIYLFRQNDFDLPPGETINVELSINVPSGTPDGEYFHDVRGFAVVPGFVGEFDEETFFLNVMTVVTSIPESTTALASVNGTTWINWTWINPAGVNFEYTMVYINGSWKVNISEGFYNATGLTPDTVYEIGTRTVDINGNINQTWVNHTARTVATADIIPFLKSIDVTPRSKLLLSGDNFTFTASPRDQYNNTFTATMTWSSSNTTVGTVNETTGLFTALAPGTSMVNATNGSVTGAAIVTVVHFSNTSNLIKNPDFESGISPWIFWTNGTGKFTASSLGYEGNNAAKIVIYTCGTNVQLYQKEIPLESNTRYRLRFAAYSTTGHDMDVKLIKHGSPYTSYGLNQRFDLNKDWQEFSTEFITTGFSGTVNDARLMFWLAPFATAGDRYYIDDVRLEKVTQTGTLNITTIPASGDIYIDSVKKGTGSWSELLSVGSHNVSFGPVSGYLIPPVQTVEVLKDQTTPLIVTYAALPNIIQNPDFESGTSPWIFWTNGTGKFTTSPPGYEGDNAAKIFIYTCGTNVQLYQMGISLEPNIRYRLRFAAYSTTGHDMDVKLIKHGSPYTSYGLNQRFDLNKDWQEFSTEFITTGFTGTVTDARLMFWLAPFAVAGDKYYIDDVRLEKVIPQGNNL